VKIKDIPFRQLLKAAHSRAGLCIDFGMCVVRLRSRENDFLQALALLYQDFQVVEGQFIDFHIDMQRPVNYRRWMQAQIVFSINGAKPFDPFPVSHALPLFEWGLNWCIAKQGHHHLMLHAGAVEKNGKAIIFPALPGSGKSTLSAALALRGWRLLSDEFGLVRAEGGLLQAMPRPIPLKNASIQVIQDFEPSVVLGPLFPKTRKGTVAHCQPSTDSAERCKQLVKPAFVVFPQYQADSQTVLEEVLPHYAFLKLASNAFNYEVMGRTGFERLTDIVNSCICFNLTYSDLDHVIARLDGMVSQ